MKVFRLFLALSLAVVSLSGCDKESTDSNPTPNPAPAATSSLELDMDHVVGASSLVLNAATPNYTTPSGDHFSVTTFRYYVSNIKLRKDDGTDFVQPGSYYLVDAAKPESRLLTIKDVPVGDYTGLTFTIGVDSTRNVSGVQQGALAPSDMFWSWNTGYIFLKLEGRSPETSSGGYLFHVGGFRKPTNAIRTVSPTLPAGVKMLVRANHVPEVHLKVDVMKVLVGPTPDKNVRFATFAPAHMPGASALQLADNYAAGMFRIDHVHAN